MRLAVLLFAVGALGAFAWGCGGSDGGNQQSVATAAPRNDAAPAQINGTAYARAAEAICAKGVRETQTLTGRLGKVFSESSSSQEAITNGIVGGGLKILESEAARLRNLADRPGSAELETYLGLFEPIVELGRQRLEAGRESEVDRGHQLELLIVDLSHEQSAAASKAGLDSCSTDFFSALGGVR